MWGLNRCDISQFNRRGRWNSRAEDGKFSEFQLPWRYVFWDSEVIF